MKKFIGELPNFPLARCRGTLNPDIFHGDNKREKTPHPDAEALCRICTHSVECLAWALQHNEFGTWGGTTDYQRAALLRDIHRVRCPGCGSFDIYNDYYNTEICLSCGLSWVI